MAKEFPLAVVIRAVDRVTAPIAAIQRRIAAFDKKVGASFRAVADKLGGPALMAATGQVGSAFGELGGRAATVAGVVGGLGAAVAGFGAVAARSLISTASEFERFQTILETVEGSSEGAKASMKWVSDFAAKTPFELAEVTDNFVRLRAYGIDPTKGTLKTLGDTAAAMGRPLEQAVEALADAVTGENERLKEFGITASKVGEKIYYQFTNKNGKQMKAVVNANNRAMIESTLTAIWNENYGGAADKLSQTWEGMVSNLLDAWARFKLKIMASGPFDALKTMLGDTLQRINDMADSGQLEQIAQRIGGSITAFVEKVPERLAKLKDAFAQVRDAVEPVFRVVGFLFDKFGAGNVIIIAIASAVTMFLLPAIVSLTGAVKALGLTMAVTPIGVILAGVALLVAALVYLYNESEAVRTIIDALGAILLWLWEYGLKPAALAIWTVIKLVGKLAVFIVDLIAKVVILGAEIALWLGKKIGAALGWAWGKIRAFVDKVIGVMPDWLKGMFGGGDGSGGTINVAGTAGAPLGAAAAAQGGAAQDGQVHVTLDLNNLPPGARVRTEQSGHANVDLNMGYQGYAPGF